MTDNNENEQFIEPEQLQAFMLQRIKSGQDQTAIASELEQMGIDKAQASTIASSFYTEIMRAARDQTFTSEQLPLALIGAILAALAGGAAWAMIMVYSGYELGFVAWGLGLLSGTAVVYSTRGKKGTPLQIMAVISAVFGILLGKYFALYYYMNEAISAEYGAEAAGEISIVSTTMFFEFVDLAPVLFGGYDLLWAGFAILTAWQIPKGAGITPPAHMR